MRLKFITSLLMLAAVMVLAACNGIDAPVISKNQNSSPKPAGPETIYPDGARRITTDELATMMKEGKVYLVDVRTQDSFDMGHIPGARLIPSTEIHNHINELPRDKTIVTYCS
jgi:3-mercaptopyruvate sulfurtransferase SseA